MQTMELWSIGSIATSFFVDFYMKIKLGSLHTSQSYFKNQMKQYMWKCFLCGSALKYKNYFTKKRYYLLITKDSSC